MPKTLLLVPNNNQAGLNFVTNALFEFFQQANKKAVVLKIEDLEIGNIEKHLANNAIDALIDELVELYFESTKDAEIVIIKGLSCACDQPYATQLHKEIALAISASVVVATSVDYATANKLPNKLLLMKTLFDQKNIGCIMNKVENPGCSSNCGSCQGQIDPIQIFSQHPIFRDGEVKLLGCIPLMPQAEPRIAANFIIPMYLDELLASNDSNKLTPAIFRYQLINKARNANKTIVLPEGDEIRTIEAADICTKRGIANCILLGDETAIRAQAVKAKIQLDADVKIVDPETIRTQYIEPMVELRKKKGLTAEQAQQQLHDNVVLGTMMVQMGDADGLVSGATHTTADTIRPALQLIKMPKTAKLVSSLFFMCFKQEILAFSDCAINPKPDAQQLADIAIQSADSAKLFGINPKVAMISYSTGASGIGEDVDKVREATKLAQELRPDLEIDGPLQYDTAIEPDVAIKKLPNSKVAGRATVFIFPDLNTGNTVYKVAQRTGRILAIGPMLQGLNKPVNDLSRGCLVEDIVFTIALTAIQAIEE